MAHLLLSLTAPAPDGFQYEPAPQPSVLRRGAFCLYSDDLGLAQALVEPLADKACGLIAVPGERWQWEEWGPFCKVWTVPRSAMPAIAAFVACFLDLLEQSRHNEDRAKAQTWEAQRAIQDKLFLSQVHGEFLEAIQRTDQNIRDAHQYLNQIIEFLPDATLVIDGDKKVVAWNKAMESITGVRKEDMLGKGDYEYAIPFYGERRPILVDLLYLSEDEVRRTYDFVKREENHLIAEVYVGKMCQGRGAYALGSASLLFDQQGQMIGAIETVRDITERKLSVTALQESHARLDAMAQNVPGVVFQFYARKDGSMGFYYLSQRIGDILGVASDVADPRAFAQQVHAEDRESYLGTLRDAVGSMTSWDFEGRFLKPSGSVIWCQALASPIIRHDELIYSGVVVDVTDRHLAIEQLRRAKLAAEAANTSKSMFLSNVSHEIRTPLNGIIGFTELILAEQNPENMRQMARSILQESEILLALVNAVLDQARLEAGKLQIEYDIVDLQEIAATVIETVGVQARKKGLRIAIEASPGMPRYFCADRLRLCQVLLNLANNSVKFTQKGSVTIRIAVERWEPEKVWMRFEVADTGMGIPENKKKLVFQRFAQVDAAASRKHGGAGLGLSLAQGLVELMGGKIHFESVVGEGSTFRFVLPLAICEQPDDPAPRNDITAVKPKILASPTPVLLAEDYPPNQEVARMHLELAGYQVDVAADGIAALLACEAKQYALILMDVQMPNMDGLETTRRLRALAGWTERVPILGLTADASEATRRDCMAAGMNAMITKPIRRKILLGEAARLLAGVAADTWPTIEPADKRQPMNYKEAEKEFGGDRAILDNVVRVFTEMTRMQLPELERRVANGEREALRAEAHKIKGAAANIAAMRLSAAAKALEDRCKAGDPDEIPRQFDKMKTEIESQSSHRQS